MLTEMFYAVGLQHCLVKKQFEKFDTLENNTDLQSKTDKTSFFPSST